MASFVSDALPAELYNQLPDNTGTWVIKDLLPTSGSLSLYGSPKAGKSHFALQLAHAITGQDTHFLHTFELHTHGRVLYLQLDTPRSLWKQRTRSYQALGLDQTNLILADREMAPFPFEILHPQRGKDWLRRQCDMFAPIAVVIDVYRNLTMADEDSSGDTMRVLNALIEATQPAATIVVSHAKKANLQLPPEDRDNLMQDNRGSSAIPGAVDGILKLTTHQMIYQSRTIDEHRVPVYFSPTALWCLQNPPDEDFEAIVAQVLSEHSGESQRAQARVLAAEAGVTEEAARKILQRR